MLSEETQQKKLVSSRAWKARNKERANELSRAYYRQNPERFALMVEDRKDRHLRARYGITLVQFDQMLQSQGGLCDICGVKLDSATKARRPHVDHDHGTGEIRGILCGSCNAGLGNFKDALSTVIAAAHYLL